MVMILQRTKKKYLSDKIQKSLHRCNYIVDTWTHVYRYFPVRHNEGGKLFNVICIPREGIPFFPGVATSNLLKSNFSSTIK